MTVLIIPQVATPAIHYFQERRNVKTTLFRMVLIIRKRLKTIFFAAYRCGISARNFSDKVMIYEPLASYHKTFTFDELPKTTVNVLLSSIKKDAIEFLGEYGAENLSAERVYISTQDALIGMQKDKTFVELFEYFSTEEIQLVYFLVGGASIHCMGYRFTVHPDEEIHRHTPHVHVCKDGESVRYSLDTLERFEQDKLPREYKRDEKKVIIPYLKKNQERLMGYWNHYMNGYTVPVRMNVVGSIILNHNITPHR